jgi:hypothetical protein
VTCKAAAHDMAHGKQAVQRHLFLSSG